MADPGSTRVIVVRHPDTVLGPDADPLHAAAHVIEAFDEPTLRAALAAGADVAFVWDFDSDLMRRVGPGPLRWVQTSSIGVDALTSAEFAASSIAITNTRGVFERPIAEWVLAVLLYFAKDLGRTVEAQRAARWEHRLTETIHGRRALVLGAGGVGRQTALLLRAAGMAVDVLGRRPRADAELGHVHGEDDLDRLLAAADDVVVALPLTADTTRLVDARFWQRTRAGVRFVNVGRGALVDEDALVTALRTGHVAAAALDVFTTEPLPAEHPLWRMPNVLVSPHMSGDVVDYREQAVHRFLDNLARWVSGAPLRDRVDRALLRPHASAQDARPPDRENG